MVWWWCGWHRGFHHYIHAELMHAYVKKNALFSKCVSSASVHSCTALGWGLTLCTGVTYIHMCVLMKTCFVPNILPYHIQASFISAVQKYIRNWQELKYIYCARVYHEWLEPDTPECTARAVQTNCCMQSIENWQHDHSSITLPLKHLQLKWQV